MGSLHQGRGRSGDTVLPTPPALVLTELQTLSLAAKHSLPGAGITEGPGPAAAHRSLRVLPAAWLLGAGEHSP